MEGNPVDTELHAPPRIGTGEIGTLHLDGQRVPPGCIVLDALPLCGGESCPAWWDDGEMEGMGACLAAPESAPMQGRRVYVTPQATVCRLGVQGAVTMLDEALAWVEYLGDLLDGRGIHEHRGTITTCRR